MNNKAIIEWGWVGYEEFCSYLGACYPSRPSASVDNTLLDLQNSSYPTRPHSIIAKYGWFTAVFPLGERFYNLFLINME